MGLGNGYADWNASDYAPGSDCIDTNRPFQVAFSLPLHSDGGLAAVQVELSQDGGPCRPTASIGRYTVGKADGLATLTKVMQQGMTPVVSYWSSKETDVVAGRARVPPDVAARLCRPRRSAQESSGANVDNCTKEKPCNLEGTTLVAAQSPFSSTASLSRSSRASSSCPRTRAPRSPPTAQSPASPTAGSRPVAVARRRRRRFRWGEALPG
ncbi:unnamed protein product [Prorocentrum cordatum]|uniref:Beta-galactosidase n=1 Tax=Prorocentrum cordatum TaxID=2364126 RepID=A0ABN9TN65_9DINO|nr:unnamed protein product [Polarella glacialis]